MPTMTRMHQGSGTRLHQYAPLIIIFALLGGCQANQAGQADSSPSPVENVSLFGVRIGMTPDQLNAALPGAHCTPTTEKPACDVSSTGIGSSGVDVQFSNGRVAFAYAEGEMGRGLLAVSRGITEQLGPPQQKRFDDHYVDTWTAKDGSELALLTGHIISEPQGADAPYATMTGYTLVLSSLASRTQRAAEREAARQKIKHDLTNTLAMIFEIDPAGHVAVCGIHVGAAFEGKLGCPASARAELLASPRHTELPSPFELRANNPAAGCNAMLGPHLSGSPFLGKQGLAAEAPTAKVCVRVKADAATHQVKAVSATVPSDAASANTIDAAFMALENAGKLDSHFTRAAEIEVLPSWTYANAFGDVITLAMGEDKFAFGEPLGKTRKMLTISISGKTAEASFR